MQTSIDKIKTQVFQDFLPNIQFIRAIGQGAFAQVFLIYDQKQKMYLAVKKISLFGLCQYERKLVLTQAKILSSIYHPNVIQFHSCIYDNNEQNVYIFMEYAKEGDLLNFIYRARLQRQQIKQNVIWKIISDITQALNYLHTNGIIHRDVKPANILKQGQNFKLADMNVSKIKEQGNMTKTNVGTPLYTSPQVARNQYYNQKCDIWSLGVVIYQLCCFKNPFTMNSLSNFKKDYGKSAIDKIPLRYSRSLSELIKKMLHKDPIQRISIKQILQLCQKQGLSSKYISNQHIGQFKTIVFSPSSQRWVNLVQQKKKKEDLNLTIDQILKQSEVNQQNNTQISFLKKKPQNFSIHLVQEQYCLSRIQNKNHILKNLDQNIMKIDNFMKKQQDQHRRQSQYRKLGSQRTKMKLKGFESNQKNHEQTQNLRKESISNQKRLKFHRDSSRQRVEIFHSKDKQQEFTHHSRQKPQNEYGVKFIKLSKNIQKQKDRLHLYS